MRACRAKMITGNIHSFETFGTHEGPGIRFVVFMQGCKARCLYCHNPDTWKVGTGKVMSAEEVMERIDKCLPYIKSSNGGVTVSGGEPLLQMDFLLELFKQCKEKGIHTAIDTSAFYEPKDAGKLIKLMSLTGLFLVDIKAMDKALHKRITTKPLEQAMSFISLLEDNKKNYWLRYVLVPELNDAQRDLKKLGGFVSRLRYCDNLEFLPYHTLGQYKWDGLGLKYTLKGRRAANSQDIDRAGRLVNVKIV